MSDVFSKEQSRIKMVALTKNGFENVTWYSPIKDNRKTNDRIIDKMLGRYRKHWAFVVTNVIDFYEGDRLVERIRI